MLDYVVLDKFSTAAVSVARVDSCQPDSKRKCLNGNEAKPIPSEPIVLAFTDDICNGSHANSLAIFRA